MQLPHAPAIAAARLTRRFGDVRALDDVSLEVARGEFFSLLGPSGCGKTTLLRIVAGLDGPDSGALRLNGEEILAVPAHRRPVNTVFQNYALFPHMSVHDNVAFGLRMKKVARSEMETRVAKALELTRIAELAARWPAQLSGGQRQRVALARALVNEPQVLLLDEPLGALDLKLRKELQAELRALQRRTGITFLYVTHDQDEALGMSDRMAVMDHGRVVQVGTPAELYEKPRARFVAQFLGGCNLLAAQVRGRAGEQMVLTTALGEMNVASSERRLQFTVAIRPEKIAVTHDGHGANTFGGVVEATTYTGAETHAALRVANEVLRIVVVNNGGATRLIAGQPVKLHVPPEAIVVLED